jgi:ketosteroid isomerase-like protein
MTRQAATTEENLAIVERSYYWLHDLLAGRPGALDAAFRECFDEKLEVCIPEAYPEGGQVFRGRDGLQRWIDTTREVWDEWRFELERLLDAGDQVVVLVRVVARGGSSGVGLDRRTAHIWSIRDGRATRCEVYLDRSEALAVVGLQEGPERRDTSG